MKRLIFILGLCGVLHGQYALKSPTVSSVIENRGYVMQVLPAYQLFTNVAGVPTAVTSTLTTGTIPTPPGILAKCVNGGAIVDCNFGGGGSGVTCATNGGIVYWNGSAAVCTAAGSAGQVLTWPNSGFVPIFQPATPSVFYGNASATATSGQNVITLGSTPLPGSVNILLNGVVIPNSKITVTGTSVAYAGAFSLGDVVTGLWSTANSTPGSITLSGGSPWIRGTNVIVSAPGTTTINFPAASQIGDLAIACFATSAGSQSAPSGWATIVNNNSGAFWSGGCFSKTLSSGDISTGSVLLSGVSSNAFASIVVFVGSYTVREGVQANNVSVPVTLTTSSAVQGTDTAIYFGSVNSNAGANSVNRGTLNGSIIGPTAEAGVLYTEPMPSSGAQSAIFSYTSGNTHNYSAILIVETPTGGLGGTLPQVLQSQIIGLPIPVTATATPGTNVTSVTCATAVCTNLRGSYTIVGGTATTGTIASLSWPATPTIYACTVTQNGTATYLGIGNSVATTTGLNITSAVTVSGVTFVVNYECQP